MSESERLEAEFRSIHDECKGRPMKTLKAMPRTMRVLQDLFNAYLKEQGEQR